jgi:hypothetical protein
MSDDLLIQVAPRISPDAQIEVCRSFSYKLNLANVGGPQYESTDFFASRKMMVPYQHAAVISEMLYQECVQEVTEAVKATKARIQARAMRPARSA